MAEVCENAVFLKHLRNDSKTLRKHEVSHGRKRCVLLACYDVSQNGGKVKKCSMAPNAYRIRVEGGWFHVGRFVNIHFLRNVDFA